MVFAEMLTRRFPPHWVASSASAVNQRVWEEGSPIPPPMGSSIRISGARVSTCLASASVCFISFKRASATRSGFDRSQLLTIHSFMNHECIVGTSHRSSPAIVTGISAAPPPTAFSLTCPRASIGGRQHGGSIRPSLDIPPHDTKLFSLSGSIWLCYLEVSVEEGNLAKEWGVTV